MMRRTKTLILFLLLSIFGFSQSDNEMEKVLSTAMYMSMSGQYDSAIVYLDNEFDVREDKKEKFIIAMTKLELADDNYDCHTSVKVVQDILYVYPDLVPNGDKTDLTSTYNNLALKFKCLGQLDSAIKYMNMALEAEPEDPYLISNLANVYMDKGEHAKAYDLIDSLSDTSSRFNNSILIRRAECLYYMDSVESAKILLHKVVVREEYNTDHHVNFLLGEVYYRLAQKPQACAFYKAARRPEGFVLKTHPNNGDYLIEKELKRSLIIENKIRLGCQD